MSNSNPRIMVIEFPHPIKQVSPHEVEMTVPMAQGAMFSGEYLAYIHATLGQKQGNLFRRLQEDLLISALLKEQIIM